MCGIAGALAGAGARVDADAVRALTRALARRGPDGEGFHFDGPIALGHRRLAIIDVAGGAQPLYAAGGAVAGIVNGEIYNFAALRAELDGRGHRFTTRTDSEVVVHGYAEWGEDVLDRLDGMFALAVWDARAQTLLLARDRMGEKPLYYAWLADGTLVFASELRALAGYPGVDRSVDPDALARYLVYEYVAAPRSMLRGARKLAAGELLTARRDGRPRRRTYWELPLVDAPQGGRPTDLGVAAIELRDRLTRSVRDRLVSDVPLGVFLSGGLDSTLVAAIASRLRGGDLDTFSIGFEDPSYDESAFARHAAAAIGSRHHERLVRAVDLLALIGQLGELLDEPLGDGSLVPTHLLSRFAREHVTVALGGDGGDELFGGYPTFQAEGLSRAVLDRLPHGLAVLARRAGTAFAARLPISTANFSLDFKLKQFLRGVDVPPRHRHQAWLASLLPREVPALLHPDLAAAIDPDLFDQVDQHAARCASRDRWDQLLGFYARGYLADDILAKVDRASMEVALEVRAPLLARAVVELACRIAPPLRVRGGETKRILKRAARGLVPDSIIDRPKHGFGMPLAGWLRHEVRELLEDSLAADRVRRDGFFDPAAVQRLVTEHVSGQANHRKVLWTLLAFQEWQRGRG